VTVITSVVQRCKRSEKFPADETQNIARRRLRSQTKVASDAADQLSLLFGGMEKSKAALKALAISDFGFEFQWLLSVRQLQFQFNNLADVNVSRYRGAQSTLGDVLGAAKQRFFSLDNQAQVQEEPWVGSRQGPWMLFVPGHSLQNLTTMCLLRGFTGELLTTKFLDGPLNMFGYDRISVLCNFLQLHQKLLVSAIAHGYGNISS
jgi:hypothetical protein